MIADTESNKNLSLKVTELFSGRKRLNILLAFISQSYFKVPRTTRLDTTHDFFIKIPKKVKKSKQLIKKLSKTAQYHVDR